MRAGILGGAIFGLVIMASQAGGQAEKERLAPSPAPTPATGNISQRQIDDLVRMIQSQSNDLQRLNQELAQQRQILDRLSRSESTTGYTAGYGSNLPPPSLTTMPGPAMGNVPSPPMTTSAGPPSPTQGTVHVENRMPTDQVLAINQNQYTIPAGTSRDITVPVGTATSELVGYEPPKQLSITAPNYSQTVVIAPVNSPQYAAASPPAAPPASPPAESSACCPDACPAPSCPADGGVACPTGGCPCPGSCPSDCPVSGCPIDCCPRDCPADGAAASSSYGGAIPSGPSPSGGASSGTCCGGP